MPVQKPKKVKDAKNGGAAAFVFRGAGSADQEGVTSQKPAIDPYRGGYKGSIKTSAKPFKS